MSHRHTSKATRGIFFVWQKMCFWLNKNISCLLLIAVGCQFDENELHRSEESSLKTCGWGGRPPAVYPINDANWYKYKYRWKCLQKYTHKYKSVSSRKYGYKCKVKTRVGQLVFIQWMLLIKPLTNDERGGRFERWIITDRQNGQISNDQRSDRREILLKPTVQIQ